jgi:hypothetical protein
MPEGGHSSPQEKERQHPRKETGMLTAYITRIIHESQTRPWDSLHNVL